jgi:acetyl-CoA C-acetyltransferase
MAEAADALATRLSIPRDRQDAWAIRSHAKARAADMWGEIVAVADVAADAFTRALTPALAARAKVVHGSITAANAAVAADAAAFALVVAPDIAARAPRALEFHGLTIGATPWEPGTAPVAAMRRLIGTDPPALAEVMEAYAAQAIACVEGAGLDPATVNRKGGALARGHPIGASGAILAVRVFHDLRQGRGLAAIAAAGGIGTAVMFSK